MELRRVTVAAAVDTRYGAVEQRRSAGGTHSARSRHRRTQPRKRTRTAPQPQPDQRPPAAARPARGKQRHLVLPVPPTDDEKFSYVRRHTWVLTVFSILTFPPLIYGQIRLVSESPWFLLYLPFIALGLLTFLMSLFADYQTTEAVDGVIGQALATNPDYSLVDVIPIANDGARQYVWVKTG